MLKDPSTSLRLSAKETQDVPLLQNEIELPKYYQEHRLTLWRRLSYAACATIIATCVAILIIWSIRGRRSELTWTSCGRSIEAARMSGCHFHPMLSAWVPPECSALELMDEYDPYTDREWFLDENGTQSAEISMLRSGEGPLVYTANSFHISHCTYVWRVLAQAVDNRKHLINSKSGSLNHTYHCAKVIAESNADTPLVWVPLLYLTCVPLYQE